MKAVVLVGMAKYELKEALDQAGFSNYVLVDTFEQTVPAGAKNSAGGRYCVIVAGVYELGYV